MRIMKNAYRLDEEKRTFERMFVTWSEKNYIEYWRDGTQYHEFTGAPGIYWFDTRLEAQGYLDYINAPENQAA